MWNCPADGVQGAVGTRWGIGIVNDVAGGRELDTHHGVLFVPCISCHPQVKVVHCPASSRMFY